MNFYTPISLGDAHVPCRVDIMILWEYKYTRAWKHGGSATKSHEHAAMSARRIWMRIVRPRTPQVWSDAACLSSKFQPSPQPPYLIKLDATREVGWSELVLSLPWWGHDQWLLASTDSRSSYSSQKVKRRTIKPTKANLLFIQGAFKKKRVFSPCFGVGCLLNLSLCLPASLLASILDKITLMRTGNSKWVSFPVALLIF